MRFSIRKIGAWGMVLETHVTKLVSVHEFDIVHALNFLHKLVCYILFLVKRQLDLIRIIPSVDPSSVTASTHLITLLNNSHSQCTLQK